MCLNPDTFLVCQMVAYVVSCLMLSLPGNISDVVDESLILIGDLQNESSCCFICTAMTHTPSEEVTGVQLLCKNMWRHLKYLFTFNFWKLLYSASSFLYNRWLPHFFRTGEMLPIAGIWQTEQAGANHDDAISTCNVIIGCSLWCLLLFISPSLFDALIAISLTIFYCFMVHNISYCSTLPKLISKYKPAGWSSFKKKEDLYSIEDIVSQYARKHKNVRRNIGTNEA